MAKLVITHENSETKKELFFRGEVFSYSMIPDEYGRTSDKPGFERQLQDRFGEGNEEMLDAADSLEFQDDEEEVAEALLTLSGLE